MLHFKRWWPIKSFPNCCRCTEGLLFKRLVTAGWTEPPALLVRRGGEYCSGFVCSDTHLHGQKEKPKKKKNTQLFTHKKHWTWTQAGGFFVSVKRQARVRVARLRQVFYFIFISFSFMDSLLFCRAWHSTELILILSGHKSENGGA